jgi:hypothetical protein
MTTLTQKLEEIATKNKGLEGEPLWTDGALEQDSVRRFIQAIMDNDPCYFDAEHAAHSKFGQLVAPPLFPVHAFRFRCGQPDPLGILQEDSDADGSGGNEGVYFGLPTLNSPLKRLLNGGNEIEFYRNLAVGERCVATARYSDIQVKQSKSVAMLLVTIETRFQNDQRDLLIINRQTLIWR